MVRCPIVWDYFLLQRFREAKSHNNRTHTIYLPHPDEELVIKTDVTQNSTGKDHIVYDIKENELVPVRFHSTKLKPNCRLRSPHEIELLTVAVTVKTEYDLLREAENPVLLLPDSKAVQDAVQLIQQSKFSKSLHIFLTIINITHHCQTPQKLVPAI